MKPTKVVITIPLKGWSKHDSIEGTCIAIKGIVKKVMELRTAKYKALHGDDSPFDLEHMTVTMPTLRRAPSKG